MIKLTTLNNRFETDLITEALNQEEIEYVIKHFHDTAFDGLFETRQGYGLLLVHEKDKSLAQNIVDDIRSMNDTEI